MNHVLAGHPPILQEEDAMTAPPRVPDDGGPPFFRSIPSGQGNHLHSMPKPTYISSSTQDVPRGLRDKAQVDTLAPAANIMTAVLEEGRQRQKQPGSAQTVARAPHWGVTVDTGFSRYLDAIRSRPSEQPPPEGGSRSRGDGAGTSFRADANGPPKPSSDVSTKDLSPEDRPIVIGLDVSSAPPYLASAADSGLDEAAANFGLQVGRGRKLSDAASVAPTILITPAKEQSAWSPLHGDQISVGPSRRASSWYSQLSVGELKAADHHPPIPPLPDRQTANHEGNPFSQGHQTLRDSTATVFEEDESPRRRRQRMSTTTIFEEDDSPGGGSQHHSSPSSRGILSPRTTKWSRTLSTDNQGQHVTRSSLDTINTRHRSRGWWNTILSPFLTRPETIPTWTDDVKEPSSPESEYVHNLVHKHNMDDREHKSSLPPEFTAHPYQPPIAKNSVSAPPRPSDPGDTHHLVNPFLHPAQPDKAAQSNLLLAPDGGHGSEESAVEKWIEESSQSLRQSNSNNPFLPRATSPIQSHNRSPGESPSAPQPANERFSPNDREVPVLFGDAFLGEASGQERKSLVEESDFGHLHDITSSSMSTPAPPPYSPPRRLDQFPKYQAFLPPRGHLSGYSEPHSPGPVSPGLERAMTIADGVPLAQFVRAPAPTVTPGLRASFAQEDTEIHYYRSGFGTRPPLAATRIVQTRRGPIENDNDLPPRTVVVGRRRCRFKRSLCDWCCGGISGTRQRRRVALWSVIIGTLIACIVGTICTEVLIKHAPSATHQTQWLNLTGWPAIPTGTATIAQPDAVVENTGCVFPATMWSCALPKEVQQEVLPNEPDQPNFKFQIDYRNDSTSNTTDSGPLPSQAARRSVLGLVALGRSMIHSRDAMTDAMWIPSPAAPGLEDQAFLGNTTDNVTASLKEGEATPFYISFLDTTDSSPSKVRKRDSSAPSNSSNPFPDILQTVPPPDINGDGTAKAANLLPAPAAQPIRLYDRGLATEHYGFYNYFDRSIFMQWVKNATELPEDENGGSTEHEAKYRCTWAQTRFLVQVWTRQPHLPLLQNGSDPVNTGSINYSPSAPMAVSPSTDFARPGSFPYPVTITLDRHGGNITEKMIYCYGMDPSSEVVMAANQTISVENRGFGGQLVGGGQGPLGDKVTIAQGGMGGIDGGTGGCACKWQNFAGDGN